MQRTGPPGWGLEARLKKITVTKFIEVKTGSNLAEYSNEGCGSKMAVLQIMMTMMMITVVIKTFSDLYGV
jgi:hypothetical protein